MTTTSKRPKAKTTKPATRPAPDPATTKPAREERELINRHEAGSRLRCARESAGLSIDDACRLMGVSRSRITQIELGYKVLIWTRLLWWIDRLGLDPALVVPEFFTPKATNKRSNK